MVGRSPSFANSSPSEQRHRPFFEALAQHLATDATKAELRSILSNRDSAFLHSELLDFGQRLQAEGKVEPAMEVYAWLAGQEGVSQEIKARANRESNALQGKGAFGPRFEFLLKRFTQDASDLKMIIPMLAGSAVYGLSRATTLSRLLATAEGGLFTRGIGARFAASSVGFMAEVPTFALSARAMRHVSGEVKPGQEPSVAQDLSSAAITLGLLKSFSFLGQTGFQGLHGIQASGAAARLQGGIQFSQFAFTQGAMFAGLMAAHKVEEKIGLRPQVDGATTVTDTLASMLSLGVGAHLGHKALGKGFARWNQELQLRTKTAEQGLPDIYSRFGNGGSGPTLSWERWADGPPRHFANPSLLPVALSAPGPKDIFSGPLFSLGGVGEPGEKKSFDLDPYRGILENGVRDLQDIDVARKLFKDLDPEGLGKLAQAAAAIPHSFVTFKKIQTGGTRLGGTTMTYSQLVDRSQGGVAEKITLAAPESGEGIPLFVLPHEWKHATELEAAEKALFPPFDRDRSYHDLYRQVLETRYWDEALAFGTEARLARIFQKKTGQDLFSFGIHVAFSKNNDAIKKTAAEQGSQGLFHWVAQNPAYLHYKVGALALALLVKQRAEKIPQWGDLLQSLGFEEKDGAVLLNAEGMKNFYKNILRPFLQEKGIDIALMATGLISGAKAATMAKALGYFSGLLDAEASRDFLREDFDGMVRDLGVLLGDPVPSPTFEKGSQAAAAQLPPLPARPKAMRHGHMDQALKHPEKLADKVELAGKLTGALHQMASSSDESFFDHWNAYLHYAETADPRSAGEVYSLMRNALAQRQFREKEATQAFGMRWSLGLSLLRSGYAEEGKELCRKAIALVQDRDMALAVVKKDGFKRADYREILRLGHGEILEELWDRFLTAIEGEFVAFEGKVSQPPADLKVDYSFVKTLLPLISEFTRELSASEARAYPPSLRKKIETVSHRLWNALREGFQKKIEMYLERFGLQSMTYLSLDEATALHPTVKMGRFDESYSHLLIGYPISSFSDSSPALIERYVKSPLLFRLGLEFLKEYPQSFQKVDLLRSASKNLPPEITEGERLALFEEYDRAIQNQAKALADWNYIETFYRLGLEEKDKETDSAQGKTFRNSRFYNMHTTLAASILIGSKDPGARERGLDILRNNLSGSHDEVLFANVNNRESNFVPAVGRSEAWLAHLKEFQESERETLLRLALVDLSAIRPSPHSAKKISEAWASFIRNSWESGSPFLSQEAARKWNADAKNSLLETLSTVTVLRDKDLKKTDAFFQLVQSLSQGEGSLQRFLERLEQDLQTGRNLFTDAFAVESLQWLDSEALRTKIPFGDREAFLERWGIAAIDRFVLSFGREDEFRMNYKWAPLVKTLRDLSLPEAAKDRLFRHLIDASTPEPGISKDSKLADSFARADEGLELVEFIFGNPEMPNSEALLLRRISDLLSDATLNRQDPRTFGALRALAWVFSKTGDASFLEEHPHGALAGLRSNQSFGEALVHLRDFLDRPLYEGKQTLPPQDISGLKEILKNPAAPELVARREEIRRALRDELIRKSDERKRERGPMDLLRHPLTQTEREGSLLDSIYQAWQRAEASREMDSAEILFELWKEAENSDAANEKRLLYYEQLENPGLPLSRKRLIFEELSKSVSVSRFAVQLHKKILEEGRLSDEKNFYEAMIPVFRKDQIDKNPNAHHLLLSQEAGQAYLARYRRFREAKAEEKDWKLDLHEPLDWDLFENFYHSYRNDNYKGVYATLLFRALAPEAAQRAWVTVQSTPKDGAWTQDLFALDPAIEGKIRRFSGIPREKVVAFIQNAMAFSENLPSSELAQKETELFPGILARWRKNQDIAKMAFVELPEVFHQRDELTRFLLSRFFVELPVGEQQRMLSKMKGTRPEQALRIFLELSGLEKIGQFLSFWPEVPQEVRAELSHLQDQVLPSDFEEVKDTIREELQDSPGVDPADAQSILAHLSEKPLGSGSIGEVYLSRMADGTEVVVKVIPPSKAKKFDEAMRRLSEVAQLLNLYRDEIPGANETLRLTAMLFAMVRKELDLRHEKENGEALRNSLPPGIQIPAYLPHLTTEMITVQSYVKGKRMDKIQDPLQRMAIFSKLQGYLLGTQVFQEGRYHSDLQPGNLLFDEATHQIYLLDFGQMGTLSPEERAQLWEAGNQFLARHSVGLTRALEAMSDAGPTYSLQDLQGDIAAILPQWKGQPHEISPLILSLFKLCNQRGLSIRLPFLQLLKGLATFEANLQSHQEP